MLMKTSESVLGRSYLCRNKLQTREFQLLQLGAPEIFLKNKIFGMLLLLRLGFILSQLFINSACLFQQSS